MITKEAICLNSIHQLSTLVYSQSYGYLKKKHFLMIVIKQFHSCSQKTTFIMKPHVLFSSYSNMLIEYQRKFIFLTIKNNRWSNYQHMYTQIDQIWMVYYVPNSSNFHNKNFRGKSAAEQKFKNMTFPDSKSAVDNITKVHSFPTYIEINLFKLIQNLKKVIVARIRAHSGIN